MKGRGFLTSKEVGVDGWLTVELLRMEIPDLSFPFDAGGGVDRFRNNRCLVREASLRLDESHLQAFLQQATRQLDGFSNPSCVVADGVIHLSVQVEGHDDGIPVSFKAAFVTPEPARDDAIHLTLFDYRAYGPTTTSTRRLAREWIIRLLETSTVAIPSSAGPFPLEVAGDILKLRPLKWLLLSLFPGCGWKLPGTEGVRVESVQMTDGTLRLEFSGSGELRHSDDRPSESLDESHWGRRALAAHESKDTFSRADAALFSGDARRARRILEEMEDDYGTHPAWISRHIDALIDGADASDLVEARSLCETLAKHSERETLAATAHANIGWITEGAEAAVDGYRRVRELLDGRAHPLDYALVSRTLGGLLADPAPDEAIEHLESALELAPNRVGLLERLASLYRRLGRDGDLEATLKRLAGLQDDPDRRHDVLVELGRLLVQRPGEAGEGRQWLQKALKHKPDDLAALEALGESYARTGDPLRAAKTLGQAARSAEQSGATGHQKAADLHHRAARLWLEDLDDPDQAEMHARRALELGAEDDQPHPDPKIEQRALMARICEARGDDDSAITRWTEVLNACDRTRGLSDTQQKARSKAHERLGALYERRGKPEQAQRHRREAGGDIDTAKNDEETSEETSGGGDLETFRSRYEKLLSERSGSKPKPPSSTSDPPGPELDDSEPGKVQPDRPSQPPSASALLTEDEPGSDTGRAIDLDRLDSLREEDDPKALADALEEAIEVWERGDDDGISRDRWIRWHRELGELAYLELEETERARRFLEPVREFDPDGLGRDETVLRLLESVYEETGDVDGKIEVLKARIEAAESDEMACTLRVLIAQTLWDQRQSARAARSHLRDVLETDPNHLGAHRLMAKIAEAEGEWTDVVDHLQRVVDAAEGGLDEVELRRRLAEVLMTQSEDPDSASEHFKKVIDESPGDTRAIEGLKECQSRLEDWEGLLGTIAHEIGVLTGEMGLVEVERFDELVADSMDESTAVQVSRRLNEAAEIAAEHLSDLRSAQAWAGRALAMWDDNVEALELRISVDRILQDHRALARDLVRQANVLLDSRRRYETLLEAAEICVDRLEAAGSARRLLARCLQEDYASQADRDALRELRHRIEQLEEAPEDASSNE